jgi:DNA replication protein DnaC
MSDRTYQQLRSHLAYLKLTATAEQLAVALDSAQKTKPSYTKFLADLLAVEVQATEQRRLEGRLRFASFPSTKPLEDFDFDAQPTLDRRLIDELATLRFIEEKANALFIGPPGVGKTTLARSPSRPSTRATASTTRLPRTSPTAAAGPRSKAVGRPRCASGTDRSSW